VGIGQSWLENIQAEGFQINMRRHLSNVLLYCLLNLNGWHLRKDARGHRMWTKRIPKKDGMTTLRGGWKYALTNIDIR
jgi:hypothetical protein